MVKKRSGAIISKVVILLVVVAVVGFLSYFTNGFTGDFKTFYVAVNGHNVLSGAGGYEISDQNLLNVEVKYTFALFSKEVNGYSVEIVPNKVKDKNFDFTVNGEAYSFYAEKDLSAGFEIERSEKSFTVTPKYGTLTEILQSVYPEKEVSDCEKFGYDDMFSLVVYSYNGKSSVTINFNVSNTIRSLTLNEEVIVF